MKSLFSFLFVVALACGGRVDGDAGVPDASTDVAAQCTLQLSSYSTSCTVDTDCVGVFIGDACTANCFCATGAIATSSHAQYEADFAATSHGTSMCACPAMPVRCCAGTCAMFACDAGK